MDARRLKDNAQVIIKRVFPDSEEIRILRTFQAHQRRHDPANHCVPVLDVFSDDAAPEFTFLVMPLMRQFDDPEFVTVEEALECMEQFLEVGALETRETITNYTIGARVHAFS